MFLLPLIAIDFILEFINFNGLVILIYFQLLNLNFPSISHLPIYFDLMIIFLHVVFILPLIFIIFGFLSFHHWFWLHFHLNYHVSDYFIVQSALNFPIFHDVVHHFIIFLVIIHVHLVHLSQLDQHFKFAISPFKVLFKIII